MSHSFPPVTIDDVDSAGIEVALSSGTGGGRVRLSTGRTADSRAYLDPDGARAIARALLEAADEADVRTIEAELRAAGPAIETAARGICAEHGGRDLAGCDHPDQLAAIRDYWRPVR